MRPLTYFRPKPMIEVLGKPLLHHIIDSLPAFVDELVIVIGYKGEMIREYFGGRFQGRSIRYIEQQEKTGTADAFKLCEPHLESNEKFLLLYADDLHDRGSITELTKRELGLLVYEVPEPKRFGIVLTDATGKIRDIEEKPREPKSNLAVIGVYVLDPRIFNYEPDVHESGERYVTSMIQKMLQEYPMYAERASFWVPVGYPEDLLKVEKALAVRTMPKLAYQD